MGDWDKSLARDGGRLQHTIVKLSLAHENDNIEQYLWKLDEQDERAAQ